MLLEPPTPLIQWLHRHAVDNDEINDLPASVQIQITLKTPPNLRCKTTAAIGNK